MKVKVFGLGAAGNKAVIDAISQGVLVRREAQLINSTSKDIPSEYHDISYIIGQVNGAGKESKLGSAMMQSAIDEDEEFMTVLQEFIEEDDEAILVVHSAEGGTGCGAGPVLSEFIKEQIGITVHEFVLMGFQSDARGLSNTIGLFKQFDPNYVVHTICNSKFNETARNNKVLAEQMANDLFVKQLAVIKGSILKGGSQNIDDTDHFKLINNPGYTLIESTTIDRSIKTMDQLNKLLVDTIRNTKSVDIEQLACRRIGVIWSINEETKSIIDYTYTAIKDVVGEPYETFDHIQEPDGDEQSVTIIIAGLKLPTKEIQDIYDKYQKIASNVNKDVDSFYSTLSDIEINDDEFNIRSVQKSSFFNKKKTETKTKQPNNKVEQSNNIEPQVKGILISRTEEQ